MLTAERFLLRWQSSSLCVGSIDSAGNVYVVERGNYRVQVFTSEGEFLRKWGSKGDGAGQFGILFAIAVDGVGNVYVTDSWHLPQVFDSGGRFLTEIRAETSTFMPRWSGIAIDDTGNVYVTSGCATFSD